MSRKLTKEQFIEKAKAVHGDKYDYSLVEEYKGNKVKVPIVCKEHGVFMQRPNDHLLGYGCPECKHSRKLTTEEWVEMARKVHNDEYTYEHADYKGANEKITVTCKHHGDFSLKANNHLNGNGCDKCHQEGIKHEVTLLPQRKPSTKKYTQKEIIEKIKTIYGNKYNTNYVCFKSVVDKIHLVCKEKDAYGNIHGDFYITPSHLLRGQGCPKCSKNYHLTTEDFINKAKKVHGEKYDYSKTNYVRTHDKVTIICPIHGEFEQIASNHLKGVGCLKCSKPSLENGESNNLKENKAFSDNQYKPVNKNKNSKSVSTCKKQNFEKFLEKAKSKFGDKFDYSETNFEGSYKPISIICPSHGKFEILPWKHLSSIYGCPECEKEGKIKEKEEFFKKANKIHKNKYDYSKSEYKNKSTKLCIICPEHGEFWQSPNCHLNGHGCPKCGNESTGRKNRKTTEQFIEEAKKIHGEKYDYSKVNYKGGKLKVTIICPKHGEFEMLGISHLEGQGCSKCRYEKLSKDRTLSSEEFIERARKIHGDKYDYSKVVQQPLNKKMCIICPEHGEFWQQGSVHITQGSGCPKCRQPKLEKIVENQLKNEGIEYETQKQFKWLNKKRLDFYLPKYNVAIECQGMQHFKPVAFYESDKCKKEELFKQIVKRDKDKLEECTENGVKLYYFSNLRIKYPYKVYEKIEELIKIIKDENS